jgi:hypothetical protein|tara:strand:- start:1103 stop:1366 length:264 start_codon:yes stop_codon:yes gene_type:complete
MSGVTWTAEDMDEYFGDDDGPEDRRAMIEATAAPEINWAENTELVLPDVLLKQIISDYDYWHRQLRYTDPKRAAEMLQIADTLRDNL